jgi:hypothetical protein
MTLAIRLRKQMFRQLNVVDLLARAMVLNILMSDSQYAAGWDG